MFGSDSADFPLTHVRLIQVDLPNDQILVNSNCEHFLIIGREYSRLN